MLNMPGDLRGMVMASAHLASQSMGQGNNPNMLPPNVPQGGGGMHPEMMMNMNMMPGGMQGSMPPTMPAAMQGNMANMGGGPGPGGVGDMNPAGQQMMMQNMGGDDGSSQMSGMEYSGGMGMDYMQVRLFTIYNSTNC